MIDYDYHIHLSQAEHNEELASKLLQDNPFHDWEIIAGFYAAVHYFEAWHVKKYKHRTEADIPVNERGELRYSVHAWREKKIERNFSKEYLISYRKLKNESQVARYLSSQDRSLSIDKAAFNHFTPSKASAIVKNALLVIKKYSNV